MVTVARRTVRASELPRFPNVSALVAKMQPSEPVYALFPKRFDTAAKRFLKDFPGKTLYAIKANPAPNVVDILYDSGIRHFDTASLPEVELVRRRFPDAHCYFMAPVRPRGAAGKAYRQFGVRHFVLDDLRELDNILDETGVRGTKAASELTLFVRIATPNDGAALELSSKFGVDVERGAQLLDAVAKSGARPALTFHVGSLCLKPDAYTNAIGLCGEVLQKSGGVDIAALDVGGGFPAPYPNQFVPPLEYFFGQIKAAVAHIGLPSDCELMCEPGRALCAEGISVISQVMMKRDGDIYLNDGIYGSLNEMTLPKWLVEYPRTAYSLGADGKVGIKTGTLKPYRIFGPTCDTLDKLPRPMNLPETIEAGDWIEFGLMGAYSCALRTGFNGFYPDTFVEVDAV